MKSALRSRRPIIRPMAVAFALLALAGMPASAQAPSAEELRMIEFGKEIYKNKGHCQYCHKWDGSGDQGYGGNALSLRSTKLTKEQFIEVIKCGRPLTGMPYHDQFAYTDKRCFDMTKEDLGKDMPAIGEPLQAREIGGVVTYLFARVVNRGPATYEDCVDFWGKDTRQCDPMKK